ncbi:transaldolase [Actinoallomurus sp. NBC_01490]|uniref:transaldolase n=1 Tax=Actinoallomurus sp. NBC_01490 TaxID=2903557 RepID=UPI002E2FD85C|nr:transaldolase [Actinoallomurus sp. NBC_01490]
MSDILKALSDEGVSIWLDDISRERLQSGNLAQLIKEKYVVGVTSNPTIFAKALSKGSAYDEQVRELAVRGVGVEEAVRAITTYDIRWAADVLRPVYDRSDGVDGRVSIEVDPRLANETEKTVAEAKALWWLVDRPNTFIKIPATLAGLPAITDTLAQGISVNVTLIFSLERYGQVIDAFFAGLEKARANGHDLSKIESVASFFVSRVDTEIDKRLDKLGETELKGKAGIANARLAYALFEEKFGTDRWTALKDAGARPQRPLWASTGVKNPDYPDTMYVDELVAPQEVNTMPEATLDATADHGRISGNTIQGRYDEARQHLAALKEAGVDYDDVVRVLEEEGVEKFAASWKELLDTVKGELEAKAG